MFLLIEDLSDLTTTHNLLLATTKLILKITTPRKIRTNNDYTRISEETPKTQIMAEIDKQWNTSTT